MRTTPLRCYNIHYCMCFSRVSRFWRLAVYYLVTVFRLIRSEDAECFPRSQMRVYYAQT